jgi:hypothetical protein
MVIGMLPVLAWCCFKAFQTRFPDNKQDQDQHDPYDEKIEKLEEIAGTFKNGQQRPAK